MPTPHLRILKLTAENVLGIKVVEIEPSPDGSLVIIGGSNGQGKTSVLNSIWLALGGGKASRAISDPLHHGAEGGHVTLDLGDLTVTRRWAADGTSKLEVRGAQGGAFSSAQTMLDSLVGRISFDPMAFLRLRPNEQVASLLELVELPFDLDEMAAMRQGYYDERTEHGRDVTRLEGQLAGLPHYPDAPDELVDVAGLMREQRDLLDRRTQKDTAIGNVEVTRQRVEDQKVEIDRLRDQLQRAEGRLVDLVDAHDTAVEFAASLPDVNLDDLEEKVSAAMWINDQVEANKQRAAVENLLAVSRREVEARTEQINDVDRARAEALNKAAMPIEGLGISADNLVTYQGVVLDQCSGAEQLRVAISMAMALNPTLRVILVTDGSLLDTDNLALIAEMAAESDYQVWIERVGDADDLAVIIEDGTVAS